MSILHFLSIVMMISVESAQVGKYHDDEYIMQNERHYHSCHIIQTLQFSQ